MSKNKIGILGNFNEKYAPHFVMTKCFRDFQQSFDFDFEWIPTEALTESAETVLNGLTGIVAGSGPYKSKEGVINGIRYARENDIAFFGTCSGFGYAVLEFGQSIFNLKTVDHPYENPELSPGETFLQKLAVCDVGMHTISFKPVKETLTNRVYGGAETVYEQCHCVYGVNAEMIDTFSKKGLIVSGFDSAGEAKIMEYAPNNFFLITLFLPQLRSDKQNPHPLIAAFVKEATGQ